MLLNFAGHAGLLPRMLSRECNLHQLCSRILAVSSERMTGMSLGGCRTFSKVSAFENDHGLQMVAGARNTAGHESATTQSHTGFVTTSAKGEDLQSAEILCQLLSCDDVFSALPLYSLQNRKRCDPPGDGDGISAQPYSE